jgi:hypothetical protein
MHVGWSLLAAVAGFRPARLLVVRVRFAGQPALMTIAVTATGHFFLDSVAGAGIALASMALAALARSARQLGLTCRARSVRLARTLTGTGALPGSALRVSHTFEESRCPPTRFRAGRLVPARR